MTIQGIINGFKAAFKAVQEAVNTAATPEQRVILEQHATLVATVNDLSAKLRTASKALADLTISPAYKEAENAVGKVQGDLIVLQAASKALPFVEALGAELDKAQGTTNGSPIVSIWALPEAVKRATVTAYVGNLPTGNPTFPTIQKAFAGYFGGEAPKRLKAGTWATFDSHVAKVIAVGTSKAK